MYVCLLEGLIFFFPIFFFSLSFFILLSLSTAIVRLLASSAGGFVRDRWEETALGRVERPLCLACLVLFARAKRVKFLLFLLSLSAPLRFFSFHSFLLAAEPADLSSSSQTHRSPSVDRLRCLHRYLYISPRLSSWRPSTEGLTRWGTLSECPVSTCKGGGVFRETFFISRCNECRLFLSELSFACARVRESDRLAF